MSLAELLKADLEDLEEDVEEEEVVDNADSNVKEENQNSPKMEVEESDNKSEIDKLKRADDDQSSVQDDLLENTMMKSNNNNKTDENGESVKKIAKLLESIRLNTVIEKIAHYQTLEATKTDKSIKKDDLADKDPEYKLIVEANGLTVEIDNEIQVIYKYVRDKYSKRFPELESLVHDPLDYVRTVRSLGNQVERAKITESLQSFLTTATIMVLSVSASTTQGTPISAAELACVDEACKIACQLNEIRLSIFNYVESRMTFIAPNLSLIVGASTAAKLMGIAGGLTNLSKMPACNVLLLGQQKKTLAGFSSVQVLPHTGYVYHADVVQRVPPDLRRKVARIVASKCTLAARVDSFHTATPGAAAGTADGASQLGIDLKAEVDMRIEKLQEPPPVKQVKSLPTPIEQARKKRGGRRARKMKERMGTTELRKQANRMTFGEIEEDAYQDDLSFSAGQIGKSGSGRVRAAQVDSKTKARISQKLQKTIQKQNQWGGATTVRKSIQSNTSGTASSVAFTTLQGLEIVNPNAAEFDAQAKSSESAKYFSSGQGFSKVSSVIPKI